MNSVTLKTNIISDRRIEYDLAIEGEWKKYFTGEKFWVEYSQPLKNINNSVAVIPALGTLLPIAWVFNGKIYVEEVDEDFYNAIPNFKNGYINMYPQLEFKGELFADKITKNNNIGESKTAALFSGGVDAFSTFLSHIDEKPALITIWGADIACDNESGWSVVEKHRKEVLNLFGVEGITIKSSFRKTIEEGALSQYSYERTKDNWWHGFHHGLGMFALTAPVAFEQGYSKIYVASSFTPADAGKITCASDPTIDNFVKFCGCGMVHDGYENNRQDKVHGICEYAKNNKVNIPVRVCWESTSGSNCCECEKCFRTMLAIYAEKQNPENFGFSEWNAAKNKSQRLIKNSIYNGSVNNKQLHTRYEVINKKIRENYSKTEIDSSLMWFYSSDMDSLWKKFNFDRKIKKAVIRITPKSAKKLYKKTKEYILHK